MPYKKISGVSKPSASTDKHRKEKKQIPKKKTENSISISPLSSADFPIVGVGASAGGLAAFEAFFSGAPPEAKTNMAFVLIQHLAPDHKSILTDIVQRYTKMMVYEIEDGMHVNPNSVYVIPPNKDISLIDGKLYLLDPSSVNGLRLPIDYFFSSLANDRHEKAICVILSGNGSDGTLGMRAIKSEGGMSMIQNPVSSEYDGMPTSAIYTNLADYVLSPKDMIPEIINYVNHLTVNSTNYIGSATNAENALSKIFMLLKNQFGHDFSKYKPNTIIRRIERRMALNQIGTTEAYIKFLRSSRDEMKSLFDDMLIGVTHFFRDPDAFKTLEEQVINKLFDGKDSKDEIRVWSVGCSTGEEAYSLAILLSEAKETLNKDIRIQVFASDIDKRSLEMARNGLYASSVVADIDKKYLHKYFIEEKNVGFRINKKIRDMILFAEQNVTKDPPFSNVDLICCRNLLIYFGPQLQKKVIPIFHYALKPDGYLFIGTSENIGDFGNHFSVANQRSKIFQAIPYSSGEKTFSFSEFEAFSLKPDELFNKTNNFDFPKDISIKELTEKTLLKQISKTAVLINNLGDVLYFHGHTGEYLEPAPGKADKNNIIKMAREGLQRELTIALHRAVSSNESVFYPNIKVKTNGNYTLINLSIYPVEVDSYAHDIKLQTGRFENHLYLVVLEHSSSESLDSIGNYVPGSVENDKIVKRLENELKAMEEYIQTTNEQLETANQELQSSNEEMQSLNEELQSTNEELETSKEELQSINEELTTVNNELQFKNSELTKSNDDMKNLLAGTGIGTVFVDFNLKILRFNPSITNVINLIGSDIGRPISHIASNLVDYTGLVEDAKHVIDTLVPKEIEVMTVNKQYFNMSIRPYRTLENVIEGIVITFVDISQRKQLEQHLIKLNEQMAEAVVSTVKQPLLVLNPELKITFASRSFYSTFVIEPTETIGNFIYDIGNHQLNISSLLTLLREVLSNNSQFNDYEIASEFHGIGKRKFLLSARRLYGEPTQYDLIFLAFEDITDLK